jgi:hypothetical protein
MLIKLYLSRGVSLGYDFKVLSLIKSYLSKDSTVIFHCEFMYINV